MFIPQMYPLYWTNLYVFFFIMLLLFIIKNFFFYSQKPSSFKTKKHIKKFLLKW